jgi:hypothetical protein
MSIETAATIRTPTVAATAAAALRFMNISSVTDWLDAAKKSS